MIMNLTCPECGNKFEIEESHQAKEKQAAATFAYPSRKAYKNL